MTLERRNEKNTLEMAQESREEKLKKVSQDISALRPKGREVSKWKMRLTTISLAFALILLISPLNARAQVGLAPTPHMQFFGMNGQPLAGGFVYTYVSGTTTPLATYTDFTGNFQNTNPIQLDSGGFCNIWLASATYTIAVQDQNHVPQWSVDGVSVLPASWASPITFLGIATFSNSVNMNLGGSLSGNWSGNPIFTGTLTFSNTLLSPAFTSSSTNPATSGILRLASGDTLCWRNNGNTSNLCFAKNASDVLSWQPTFPFQASAFQSGSANPAAVGLLRLSNTDTVNWRNAANSADVTLGVNGQNQLQYQSADVKQIVCSTSTPVTVATATTSSQALMTCAVPAGALNSAGRSFHFFGSGLVVTQAGATNVTFAMSWGSVGSSNLSTAQGTNANEGWQIEGTCWTQTTGSSGIVNCGANVGQFSNTASAFITSLNPLTFHFDLTISQTITLSVQFSTSSASNSCTENGILGEVIN